MERGDRSSRRSDRTRSDVDEPDVDEPGGSGGGGYSSLVQPEIDPASDQADPGQYSANAFKAMTYNALISTESGGDWMSSGGVSWFDGRNEDFYAVIAANAPDIIGIQEASSPDQQDDIGARYDGSTYEYFRWDTDSDSFAVDGVPVDFPTRNKNPMLVNTDRFTVDGSGVRSIDVMGEDTSYHACMEAMGDEEAGVEHGDHDGLRHINWLVLTDRQTDKKLIAYNTHYILAEWEEGALCAHASQSELFVALIEEHQGTIGDLPVILLGDFNNDMLDDPLSDNMQVLLDAGYVDTWTSSWEEGTRPETGGVDHIFISHNITNHFTYYDKTDLAQSASDHKSLSSIVELR